MKRLAWALWAVTLILVLVSTAISVGRDNLPDTVLYATLPLTLATVGTLVALRQPHNAIGWLFCGLAVFVGLAEVAEGYGLLAAEEKLPAGNVGTWVTSWSWLAEIWCWSVVFLIFPDGRLPTSGSRWVLRLSVLGVVVAVAGTAFGPLAQEELVAEEIPFLIDSAVLDVAFVVGLVLLIAGLIGAAVSFVLRQRRARGVERVQLKWFSLAAAVAALVGPMSTALWQVTPVVHALPAVAFNALPVAAGIGILRHGLYDVDVVIKRTLVYGSLTLALVGAYTGLVLLLQLAFIPLARESDLVVAGSTLAVAALFRPLRTRIQRVVDRRFYRERYDAARTMEGFSGRLRDQIDLDGLGTDLRAVVYDTMQPSHVSLWLRNPR
jgi:hypothetical protein